jgi:hypothetical protein
MNKIRLRGDVPGTMCLYCQHFKWVRVQPYIFACDAFPNGILDEINLGKFDHRKPHPEDNGIQFELIEEEILPDWFEEIYQDHDSDS